MYKFHDHDRLSSDGALNDQLDSLLLLNDRAEPTRVKGVKEQIKADNYFANLAKVLDLAGQMMEQNHQGNMELVKRLKKDLTYLQRNYKIVKKR